MVKKCPDQLFYRNQMREGGYGMNQEQSISRWKKMSKKKKLAYILGLGFAASGVYHTSLDEQNKRKIRVVIGGIGRFIRLVAFHIFL
jgi:hypothetical protein